MKYLIYLLRLFIGDEINMQIKKDKNRMFFGYSRLILTSFLGIFFLFAFLTNLSIKIDSEFINVQGDYISGPLDSDENKLQTADANGPYIECVDVSVYFDGSGSSDNGTIESYKETVDEEENIILFVGLFIFVIVLLFIILLLTKGKLKGRTKGKTKQKTNEKKKK